MNNKRRGQIEFPDRLQRLVIGTLLMLLTLWGLSERFEWTRVVALMLQLELLLTGIAGWCPIYWGCRTFIPPK
ncbi:hypothetical protein CA51_10570 [Rosistilla oblonga]|uniref:YgaP-like transmembrane domain n=1 Tax=Rosistilla oblonga TaxID=2527990 RepID=UPI001188F454|nr:YgaP-like transmembrane domain [Rosistilla oblonga]QDV11196.1 hypothetical protein CA51_10570 [Rosistilla oblonga]